MFRQSLARQFGRLAGVAMLAAASLGCSVPSEPSRGVTDSSVESSGAVQPKVARIVLAVAPPPGYGASPNRLDNPSNFQLRPMYEYLVGIDPESGKFTPKLATEWKLEPNGKSWRFQLRKGVPFHGQSGEFTAKDVVFSHWDVIQTGSLNSDAAFFQNDIQSIESVDDYQVIMHLKQPDSDFLNLIGEQVGGMMIESKADYERSGSPSLTTRPLAGTGPYQFKEWAQGSFVRFERTPDRHWGTTPDHQEFEFRWTKEASTRLAALLTGEVQMAALPQDLQPQAETKGMRVIAGRVPALRIFGLFHCCMFADPADPAKGHVFPNSPLMDIRVRQALNKAINRDELNKTIFAGKAQPMHLNPFHPKRVGWNSEWERRFPAEYGYDPARARTLLEAAGFSAQNPYKLTLLAGTPSGFPEQDDVAEALAVYWRRVGVQVEQLSIDSASLSARGRQKEFGNHVQVRSTGSSQLLGFLVHNQSYPGIGNGGNTFDTPEQLALGRRIKQESDERRQEQLWREVGDLAFSQFPNAPLFWLPAEVTVNSAVVGDYLFPGSITGTWTHVENIKAAK